MENQPSTESLRTVSERNARALSLRPALGQKTAITTARIVDGLRCEVEEGRWKIVADASEKSGGTAAGPDPGFIGRAALGACLAMGYVTWAARFDVPLARVEVELQADFDVRGQYGQDEVRPGYTEIRCLVRIESSAQEADVRRVVDAADAASMYWDVFANPVTLVRDLRITKPE